MSDPAIEAADRAWDERGFDASAADIAREALAPIRAVHHKWEAGGGVWCRECEDDGGAVRWPCPTARLCYTTEELQ